jgi:hypothetical protein
MPLETVHLRTDKRLTVKNNNMVEVRTGEGKQFCSVFRNDGSTRSLQNLATSLE